MNDKPTCFSIRNNLSSRLLIELHGCLSAESGPELQRLAQEIGSRSQKPVLINFSGVERVDASGLIQLVVFLTRLKNITGSLSGYGVPEPLKEIFEFSRIFNLMRIFPDEKTALTGVYEEK